MSLWLKELHDLTVAVTNLYNRRKISIGQEIKSIDFIMKIEQLNLEVAKRCDLLKRLNNLGSTSDDASICMKQIKQIEIEAREIS